jgi:hypothetical protein
MISQKFRLHDRKGLTVLNFSFSGEVNSDSNRDISASASKELTERGGCMSLLRCVAEFVAPLPKSLPCIAFLVCSVLVPAGSPHATEGNKLEIRIERCTPLGNITF